MIAFKFFQHIGTGKEERLSRIELSTKVLDSADRLRDTLIHEMCHASRYGNHLLSLGS